MKIDLSDQHIILIALGFYQGYLSEGIEEFETFAVKEDGDIGANELAKQMLNSVLELQTKIKKLPCE